MIGLTFRYKQCYGESVKLFSVELSDKKRDERIHGGMLVLNELVRCSNAAWERKYNQLLENTDTKPNTDDYFSTFNKPRFILSFNKRSPQYQSITNVFTIPITESSVCRQLIHENYDSVCLDVLMHRHSRYIYVQQTLLLILPRLAAFDRNLFVKNHLPITMNYLLTSLKSREKDRASAFITIGLIAVAVEDAMEPYMERIMEVIKMALPKGETSGKKRITIDASVFKCITFLGHALKVCMRIKDLRSSYN